MQLSEIKPQFVIVMGGAGSGKSHFIATDPTYSQFRLVDVDEIKKNMSVSDAIQQIFPTLQSAFSNHENVAHPTIGVNLPALKKKIELAHQYGYSVTLILIDTDPAKAINQVRQRVRQGGHDVEIDNIVVSNKKARENFDIIRSLSDTAKVL